MSDGSISLISKIRATVKNPTRAIAVDERVCACCNETKVAGTVDVNDRSSRDAAQRDFREASR